MYKKNQISDKRSTSNKESGEVLMTIVIICIFVMGALGVAAILGTNLNNRVEAISESVQSTAPTSATSPVPDAPSDTAW